MADESTTSARDIWVRWVGSALLGVMLVVGGRHCDQVQRRTDMVDERLSDIERQISAVERQLAAIEARLR